MSKKSLLTLIISFYAIFAFAENKLSLRTQFMINHHKEILQNKKKSAIKLFSIAQKPNSKATAQVIITLHETCSLPDEICDSLNIDVISDLGSIITTQMPIENISKLAELDEVKSLSTTRRVHLLNDSARFDIGIDQLHNGFNLNNTYKGKDVIVGIVDSGIDYNHINFKDSKGNTRVKQAGKFNTITGLVDTYTTPEKIATLTTDCDEVSHGTHVSGIATGSYTDNNYYGMAPESDILLYGLEDGLYDANIINSIKEIFDYADSVNKPAVVNISLGANSGPHDNSDYFNRSIDELTGEGKIVVFAAGNEGANDLYINSTFKKNSNTQPQLATIVEYDGSTEYYSEVDAWSRGNEPFGIQFFIYDTFENTELLSSGVFYPTSTDYKEFTWKTSKLSNYYTGTIAAFGQLDINNNRYELYAYIEGDMTSYRYKIGIKYYGKQNTEIDCWANPEPTQLTDYDNPDYTKGTPDGSFNSMGCADNAINIGAYSTKKAFHAIDGELYYYPYATKSDIADFSSYGTDINGRNYPDVVAPGYTIISSVNNYDTYTTVENQNTLVNIVSVDGNNRKYHWGDMSGTSMAAPVATGTIALWLQAQPDLTPEKVRSIMTETATNDKFTQKRNSIQWGAGKLNAYDGLVKILQDNNSAINDISTPNDAMLLYPNPSNGNFSIFIQNESTVKVAIYTLNGTMVYSEAINTDNGLANLCLNGILSQGLYLLKVEGKCTSYSTKLVIK